MRSLAAIKSEFYSIADRLNAPRAFVRFAIKPRHDGSTHIEMSGNTYAYVITERGEEFERRTTMNDDDILYWIVSDMTREMASEYELSHRMPNADSRRILFQKHVELLGSVRHEWQARKQAEYATVLERHPFDEAMANK